MYRLIIVDDEYLTRLGLSKSVPWKLHNVEVVGLAGDGKEGLALIRELKPDLVLSDIRMPYLNGVSMIKALKDDGFAGEIIVLTAYKDFDYAVQTYSSGIFSYVLKPIENEELLKVVDQAIAKLEEKKANQVYKEKAQVAPDKEKTNLLNLLGGPNPLEASQNLQLDLSQGIFLNVISEEKQESGFWLKLKTKIANTLEANGIKAHLYIEGERVIGFLVSKTIEEPLSLCLKLLGSDAELEESLLTLTLVPFLGAEEIPNAYQKSLLLIKKKLLFGFSTVEIEQDSGVSYRHYVAIQEFYHLVSLHYSEPLTVSYISSLMNVSESYLMHLLKDSLGKTFNEIVTEYRVSLAKRLLKEGKLRINEIADKVGYNDEKYFSRVFKKLIGCNPSDYH